MDLLSSIFGALWGGLKKVGDALRRLHFADIWNAIKRGLDRFHRALLWYNEHIIKPWERMRQQLIALYNKYLGPIIKLLDTVRTAVRIIAIFNRKLAAAIDQALWKVESALYAPLYAALRRINSITSTLRAMVTPLGLLDRALLVQSIERDWKSIWRVLLNNGKLPRGPVKTSDPHVLLQQMDIDFKQFVQTGTGRFADANTQLERVWNDTLQQVG